MKTDMKSEMHNLGYTYFNCDVTLFRRFYPRQNGTRYRESVLLQYVVTVTGRVCYYVVPVTGRVCYYSMWYMLQGECGTM
jgi:hypothetical protein